MPGLTTARDAAVAHLADSLPGVRVSAFSGGLSGASLSTKNLPGSAVYVGVLGCDNATSQDSLDCDLQASFGALIVSRIGRDRAEREADGLALAERLALAIHGQTFGVDGLGYARILSLEPLDDEKCNAAGICIWAVTWEQRIVLETP